MGRPKLLLPWPDAASATIPDAETLTPWMTASDTAWGRLHHLGPVLGLSETPGGWTRPVPIPRKRIMR